MIQVAILNLCVKFTPLITRVLFKIIFIFIYNNIYISYGYIILMAKNLYTITCSLSYSKFFIYKFHSLKKKLYCMSSYVRPQDVTPKRARNVLTRSTMRSISTMPIYNIYIKKDKFVNIDLENEKNKQSNKRKTHTNALVYNFSYAHIIYITIDELHISSIIITYRKLKLYYNIFVCI